MNVRFQKIFEVLSQDVYGDFCNKRDANLMQTN